MTPAKVVLTILPHSFRAEVYAKRDELMAIDESIVHDRETAVAVADNPLDDQLPEGCDELIEAIRDLHGKLLAVSAGLITAQEQAKA